MNHATSKDGTVLAYDIYGEGPALVFITGAICFRQFQPVIKDAKVFSQEFKVYLYDRRGRGDSGDNASYSLQKELEDLEAIIDAAGGKAFVYGHSSGAVLALEGALRTPSKIPKVVLADPPYLHEEKARASYTSLQHQIDSLLKQRKNARALRTFLAGIGMPKFFTYLIALMPGWRTMKALAPTLRYDLSLTNDLPPLQRASELVVPALILYGEKSPDSIRSVSAQIAKAIPHATLTELKRQDHMMNPKAVLPELSAFLK